MRSIRCLTIIFICAVLPCFLVSCQRNVSTVGDNEIYSKSSPVNTKEIGITNIPTPTLTPPFTPTSTRIPIITPTLMITQIPTITLTPTMTLTPTITLAPILTLSTTEEKDAYAFDLIRTNGGCELPCLLGIEVGTSNRPNVELIFRPLTDQGILERIENRYSFHYTHIVEHFGYEQRLFEIWMGGEPVSYISASFTLAPQYVRYDYRLSVIRSFSLPEILENLGMPTSIYIFGPVQYEQNGGIMADMVLIYEDTGISIAYYMSSFALRYSPAQGFCFIEDWLEGISLTVISPESNISLLENYSNQIEIGNLKNFLRVSDLTLEDFYNIGLSVEPDPCFRLKNP